MTRESAPAAQRPKTGRTYSGTRGRRPSLLLGISVAAAASAGVLAGCSSANGAAPATSGTGGTPTGAAGTTVATRTVSGVGTVLTDQSGRPGIGMASCTGSGEALGLRPV